MSLQLRRSDHPHRFRPDLVVVHPIQRERDELLDPSAALLEGPDEGLALFVIGSGHLGRVFISLERSWDARPVRARLARSVVACRLPAEYPLKRPRPRTVTSASDMMLRDEFPVQRKRTLKIRSSVMAASSGNES